MIDVIDVARQADSKMKLSEFIKYYTGDQRPKVLNLISLEFSDTKWVHERDTEFFLSQLFFDPLSGSVDFCVISFSAEVKGHTVYKDILMLLVEHVINLGCEP